MKKHSLEKKSRNRESSWPKLVPFSLCTRGEAEIMINTQNYRIKKNHLIIMLPKQVIKPIHTTPDYEARIIFISSDYFKEKCQEMIPLQV